MEPAVSLEQSAAENRSAGNSTATTRQVRFRIPDCSRWQSRVPDDQQAWVPPAVCSQTHVITADGARGIPRLGGNGAGLNLSGCFRGRGGWSC